MNAADPVEQAIGFLLRAIEADQMAHAYLVQGDPVGVGDAFAAKAAACLLCKAEDGKPCGKCPPCMRVVRHAHPDYFRLEPEKKSRVIDVDSVRGLIRNLQQSSYDGGWKVACIRFADRMTQAASNAFLKTLEEPAPRTLILLLADALDAVLPTILSRCQRIYLGERPGKVEKSWTAPLDELLAHGNMEDPLVQSCFAHKLSALIAVERKRIEQEERAKRREDEAVKEEVFDARVEAQVRRVRQDMLEAMQLWQRDLLLLVTGCDPDLLHHADAREALEAQAAKLDVAGAMRRVQAISELNNRLNRLSRPEITLIESSLSLMS